ncbi:MAG: hypothetical protein GOVbin655_7 [Prokaryotic dsDNA virus sp.]|nr:MAG: hypothetical protein GOVbin655_7 [Prokaryotic dsDNA virus sp.]|tara:strand:- start:186 stop:911 length:726 start_codon:yes stop_codon:yes gene_type:complete
MRIYKVNGISHKVFDPDDPVEHLEVVTNWRAGKVGQWVKADDDCVIQVLRRGTMYKAKGKTKTREYIGTCTGTFVVSKRYKMDTSRRVNIYSFSGNKKVDDILIDRENLNKHEAMFVTYLASGMDAPDAYIKAFPTNNHNYASMQAGKLVKTERVQTAMKESLKPICQELGIDPKTILKEIFTASKTAEKEDVKLRALFKLADILDLEDKNKTQVTQVTGVQFKGFMPEDLDAAERPKEIE